MISFMYTVLCKNSPRSGNRTQTFLKVLNQLVANPMYLMWGKKQTKKHTNTPKKKNQNTDA